MKLLKSLGLAALIGSTSLSLAVRAEDTVKVGVLHSLSGTMAISALLRDVLLFASTQIGRRKGPARKSISSRRRWWSTGLNFAKSKQLLEQDVAVAVRLLDFSEP